MGEYQKCDFIHVVFDIPIMYSSRNIKEAIEYICQGFRGDVYVVDNKLGTVRL